MKSKKIFKKFFLLDARVVLTPNAGCGAKKVNFTLSACKVDVISL